MHRKLIILLLIPVICQAQIRKSYHALEGSYIMLQTSDVLLTYEGLRHGATEVNPAMRWAIDKHLFIPGKIVMTGAALWMCRRIYTENPRLAYVYMIAANLIYSAVVINNYQVTVRLKF